LTPARNPKCDRNVNINSYGNTYRDRNGDSYANGYTERSVQ
jgi:hypothetical protein